MTFETSIKEHIETKIPGAQAEVVMGSHGHYSVRVTSSVFSGKKMLECHRMVMAAVAPLMSGPNAPVHAIDSLQTVTP